MLDIILGLINSRNDAPCQVISGYSNKPQPSKPFAQAYLINHNSPDEFMSIIEEKSDENVIETMEYCGEFLIQFDVFGNTEKETFTKANQLKNLIMYSMRYQEWAINNIGIVNEDYSIRTLNEKVDTKEYIYKYSFDVTFESRMTVQRATDLAKQIELTLNNKLKINVGGKK